MQAKLGEVTVEAWRIFLTNVEKQPNWVKRAFEKRKIFCNDSDNLNTDLMLMSGFKKLLRTYKNKTPHLYLVVLEIFLNQKSFSGDYFIKKDESYKVVEFKNFEKEYKI
ncbi:hypothetical protein [Lactococcus allomyrinae]|uniref:Uncharacterized protein n=1 Tax=Lactococcus allomyrinae TaxID=2419773 RepID=A0A387BJZ3_9LACT|nr:hypothetical protein [Lactococcus allomyrinae]AYG01280.1 hypothetical protein D7I46_09330 [Lactococcus allomyrinae]